MDEGKSIFLFLFLFLFLLYIADNAPMPPAYIFWYHNSRMVNYDSGRGVRVQTRGEGDGARTTSRLSLPSASKGDEGNYTCSPSNTDPATVHVFIQEGQFPAQSRQSAKLFSSRRNWDSPNPSPAGECAPPPRVWGEGHTRWRERNWECPNSDEGTDTVVLFIHTYFVVSGKQKIKEDYKGRLCTSHKTWRMVLWPCIRQLCSQRKLTQMSGFHSDTRTIKFSVEAYKSPADLTRLNILQHTRF